MDKSGKVLSTAEWEQVISDFATSEPLQQRWLAAYPAQALLELALNIIAKERGADFVLKQQLLVFLEENGALLVGKDVSAGLGRVSGVLRTLLAAPGSSSLVSQTVLSQVISLAAVLALQTESQETAPGQLEALVDLLLNVVSRVNSLPDRQVRGAACEALRVLERAVPCLLHSALGHLLAFCQAERTHVAQSYILLFLAALEHAAVHLFQRVGGFQILNTKRGPLSALSEQVTSWVPSYFRFTDQGGQKPARETPLVRRSSSSGSALLSSVAPLTPYALPPFLSSTKPSVQYAKQELTEGTRKEFRRAVSFLLENNALLSEPATAEVVSGLVRIVSVVQLPVSIFKHHFSGLVHTTSPVLIHTALQVYLHFPEAYSDPSERSILLDRLAYLANDNQQTLSARLLSLNWLLALVTASGRSVKPPPFLSSLQPAIFDPIAIKTSKLEILAAASPPPVASQAAEVSQPEEQPSRSFKTRAGLFSQAGVLGAADSELGSAASLEASVAFRTLHRFLISQSGPLLGQDPTCPDDPTGPSTSQAFPPNHPRRIDGSILQQISAHLVTIAAEHPPQMPNILSLLGRLLQSRTHSECGKNLLQTLETSLLPQLKPSKTLPAYFPLFQEMVAHGRGDPKPLLNLLAEYCSKWAESEALVAGSEIGFGSQAWLRGSQVLGVCRSVMLVHPRGKIVEPLKELLDGMMDTFPDIEVRDSARTYCSLVTNLPEERLRSILSYGRGGEAESAMLLRNTSISPSEEEKPAPPEVASYIQLKRLNEPLAAHVWTVDLALENAPLETGARAPEPPTSPETSPPATGAAHPGTPIQGRLGELSTERSNVRSQTLSPDGSGKSTRGWEDEKGTERRSEKSEDGETSPAKVDRNGDTSTSYRGGASGQAQGAEGVPQSEEGEQSILAEYWARLERGLGEEGALCIPCGLRFFGQPDVSESEQGGQEGERKALPMAGFEQREPSISEEKGGLEGGNGSEARDRKWASREEGLDTAGAKERAPPAIYSVVVSFLTSGQYGPIPSAHVPFLLGEGLSTRESDEGDAFSTQDLPPEVVDIELRPEQPLPTVIETRIEFTDENAQSVRGPLQTIPVGIEDLFSEPPAPADVADLATWRAGLFEAMWAGLGRSEGIRTSGKERRVAGAQSVKLLEVEADAVVEAVEQFLGRFVTGVTGERLVEVVKEGGVIDGVWWSKPEQGAANKDVSEGGEEMPRLQLEWAAERETGLRSGSGGLLGSFQVLVFLPPRYHLLLSIEVSDWSNLAHIRTDYWPCLAHVDEFLEALVGIT